MKIVATFLCLIVPACVSASAAAPSGPDRWVGTWSNKNHSDAEVKSVSIVRDKQDFKLKFAGSGLENGGYIGEGIAEWYPGKNGRGAYVADFNKDGARMHVVVTPTGNRVQTTIYTKYDDGRSNSYVSQSFSKSKR